MHWRLDKYLIEQSVQLLRRVFSYNSEWNNKDIEIVQVASGSSTLVFEQFFNEPEKYPIIVISPLGGSNSQSGFNDLWRDVTDDKVELGERGLSVVEISNTDLLEIPIPEELYGESVRGIDLQLSWTGVGEGGNILINFYKNFTTSPELIGSGSFEGTLDKNLNTYFIELSNNISLTGEDLYFTLQTTSNNSYFIAFDNSASFISRYNQNNNISNLNGSIVGSIYLPAFKRIGGDYHSSLNFKVFTKNDTKSLYNLADLISIYFTLTKHSNISRRGYAVNGLSLSESRSVLSELSEKGIYVKSIKQGGVENRRRGKKDIIYARSVNIEFFSEWFQDFPMDTIKNIEVDANSFLENLLSS